MNGHSDILIIGGGIGGMTAALYAARANLSVRIVEKEVCGGLVNWTHTVENVPSYKSIHGMDLMTACREHVESLGVTIEEVNEVEEVRLVGQPKEVRTSEGDSFTADVVVSPQFFAWIFGFHTLAQIVGPQDVVEEMGNYLAQVAEMYAAKE